MSTASGILSDRIPVIVGVGEITDRPADPLEGLEPLALMSAALERADQDGGGLLPAVDSLDVVNLVSWRYADVTRLLCERTGIAPRRAVYGPVGGETPVRYLHEAALRIARGESEIAAIVGAEAQSTVLKSEKNRCALPWTPLALDAPRSLRGPDYLHPQAVKLGAAQPITVYPFYDVACSGKWGQTPREALAESGDLWAAYAAVAACNPAAWLKARFTADEIITPSAENRLIAWPYTKLMVANPTVNQGAAILLTSLARAREAGIAEHRLIHIWGGAAANDPRDYLQRDHYYDSHAQNAVLEAAVAIAGGHPFDALELYSCFPCVPKMARRSLGLGADVVPTVTGGLTFFGAPLNNYMSHAACAMVRRLRQGEGIGLLYGQGEFVTKHHGLVLASRPPQQPVQSWSPSVQAEADKRRSAVPAFSKDAVGRASLETCTVIYDRDGAVKHGVVILRTADGGRTLARVPAGDEKTLQRLTDLD
ncbi:MAG TPA: acetyl-CoA acetyltransferase, partial [Steroidobacteraceae bacterium]|nr:acetyl-CoA acetyltransferase [Steroidobacteraceae bacterium]